MRKIVLDVHAHLAPVLPERIRNIEGIEWRPHSEELLIDGRALAIKAIFKPEALLAWMDEHGIESAWVSIPPPLYRPQLDECAGRVWCDYVKLDEICRVGAPRLKPLFHLPLEHPNLAASVAERASGAGFAAPARDLSDKALDQLWQILHRQDAFLFIHPGACCDRRLESFYLENLLGNPYETGVAIAHLVFGGLRSRYPGIHFCFAHGGGVAAMLAGRFQQGFDTKRPGISLDAEAPREALKGIYVDCIVHDAAALTLAAKTFGEDHILFGSDWPFPMGLQRPHEQLANAEESLQEAIFSAAPLRARLQR